jgi:hypothetical protein
MDETIEKSRAFTGLRFCKSPDGSENFGAQLRLILLEIVSDLLIADLAQEWPDEGEVRNGAHTYVERARKEGDSQRAGPTLSDEANTDHGGD